MAIRTTTPKSLLSSAVATQPLVNLCGCVSVKSILVGPRSLRENGVHRFVENATVLCIGFQLGEKLIAWCPGLTQAPTAAAAVVEVHAGAEVPPDIKKALAQGDRLIAHNAELERAVFRKVGIMDAAAAQWIETAALARAWMLPEDLLPLASSLNLPGILPFDGCATMSLTDITTLNRAISSCISEAIVTCAVAARFQCMLPDLSADQNEKRFFDKHLENNERGIKIDLNLVTAASRIAESELTQTDRKIHRITSGTINLATLRNSNPGSASSLPAILKRKYQFELPTCDEDAILAVLGSPQLAVGASDSRQERRRKRTIRAILYARLRVALTGLGKLDSMLNQTSSDGRLRGQYT